MRSSDTGRRPAIQWTNNKKAKDMIENLNAADMLSKTTPVKCEECGNTVFTEGVVLRRVSRILTGDSKDGILPIPVFACTKCGHVNKEFLPKGVEEKRKPDSGVIMQ